jgi:hypothetical protein
MALHTGTVGPVIRADNMEPEVLRQLISCLSGARDGILHGSDLAVTQNGGGAMSVIVSSGFALISGTDSAPAQGQYHVYNDANVTVTVPTANGSNPRIDLICATIQDAYYAGGSNTAILQDVAGTPAASPLVPATPADSIVLAHLYVGTGAASILTANINGTTGTNNPDALIPFAPRRIGIRQNGVSTTGGTITATVPPGAAVAGMAIPFSQGYNHNYRMRYIIPFTSSAATVVHACIANFGIIMGNSHSWQTTAAGGSYTLVGETEFSIVGGYVPAVQMWSTTANTITLTSGMGWFSIDDIGPI